MFCQLDKLILKFIWKYKYQEKQDTPKVEGHVLLDYQAIVIKTEANMINGKILKTGTTKKS